MLQPLDGPSLQLKVNVGTVTVVEAKVGASRLTERKVITIQALTQNIYVYFGDGVSVPSAATIAANGLILYKKAKETYEASEQQPLYILSTNSTTDVIIIERA